VPVIKRSQLEANHLSPPSGTFTRYGTGAVFPHLHTFVSGVVFNSAPGQFNLLLLPSMNILQTLTAVRLVFHYMTLKFNPLCFLLLIVVSRSGVLSNFQC